MKFTYESHTGLWIIRVSIINNQVLDEMLKPRFQGEANGQEKVYCA